MSEYFYMSKEALDKLKEELHEMKAVKRPEASNRIAVAREFGDLKENAEYHAAKEALSLLEAKIAQTEEKVARSRVVNTKNITNEMVSIYTKVRLKDLNRNMEMEYTLVSQDEANFREKKISVTSPVGKALVGKGVGDKVDIQVPAGIMKYEIKNIEVALQ